jgi:hypothetical protein
MAAGFDAVIQFGELSAWDGGFSVSPDQTRAIVGATSLLPVVGAGSRVRSRPHAQTNQQVPVVTIDHHHSRCPAAFNERLGRWEARPSPLSLHQPAHRR